MLTLSRGILIAIEGIDGSGKSTLARSLFQLSQDAGYHTILTREPGATLLGKELRKLLQTQHIPLCQKAEYLLFAADRAQHFNDIVLPALDASRLVISDRMADSSLVYQGYGRGLDREIINQINNWTMNNRQPDLVFCVQVDVSTALGRIAQRPESPSAFEQEKIEFHEKLARGFSLLAQERKNFILVDGTQTPQNLAHFVYNYLETWIKTHHLLSL